MVWPAQPTRWMNARWPAAWRCLTDNPAKALSMHLTSGLPLVWGSGDLGRWYARRLGRQLAENADWPSVVGVLPEAVRTHAGLLAVRGHSAHRKTIFRDRTLDEQPQPRLRVMLLRDASEHPDTSAIAEAVVQTCERVAVPYESVMAHGDTPSNNSPIWWGWSISPVSTPR